MSDNADPLRRGLLKAGVLAAGSLALQRVSGAVGATAHDTPLAELAYADVQLAPGPLQRQARENHRFVLGLDEDSLLYPFRKRAGLAAPGSDLGGWYGADAFAPGATFGQWMCALARYSAIDGDAATRAKLQRLVNGYGATVDAEGRFYRENRFPAYTYDKLVGGLVEAARFGNDTSAVALLSRTTSAALPYLPPRAMPRNEHAKPGEDFSEHAWDESYTLPENQFAALRLSGDARHRMLARRFLYDDFFLALARGENALPGKHAYSHVNALSSAARASLELGDLRYFDAARQGFAMIDAQSFATGGWGPDEHFVVPGSGGLGASLAAEHKSFETPCGAYAHFKLTRYLLRMTRDPRYGDSMERVLYNTVLGALPVQPDGRAFYYSDYTRDARKGFHPDHWPCCSGTLPMVAADHGLNLCFTDAQGIYVNLYVPGQVRWRRGGASCGVAIETDYPYSSAITLTLQVASPHAFTVNLRIPAWAEGASIRINGKSRQPARSGSFVALRREWRSGDRIELELPMPTRLQAVDGQHPDTVALLAGPLALMRVRGGASAPLSRASLLSAKRVGDAHEWRADDGSGDVVLRPFVDIGDEAYSLYQDVAAA
ncbi:MAG TPA: beta-L-arabinofuranosidase domain-containing protein [Dokdonella sp.]